MTQEPSSKHQQALPSWITAELIGQTMEVWQPNYAKRLTEQDAIEILLAVGTLLDAIGDLQDETVRSVG